MENYEVRFEQIANEIKFISPFTVLDINCGNGDLYQYLTEYSNLFSRQMKYIGVDENEQNIINARERFGNAPNCSFECHQWTDHLTSDVDLVIFNGAFSYKTPDTRTNAIEQILKTAKHGFIGNFLTYNSLTKNYNNDVTLTNPSDVLKLVDSSEFRIKLIADYIPHDFTISALRWEP